MKITKRKQRILNTVTNAVNPISVQDIHQRTQIAKVSIANDLYDLEALRKVTRTDCGKYKGA